MKVTKIINDEELTIYQLKHGKDPDELMELDINQYWTIENGKWKMFEGHMLYSFIEEEELE